MFTDGRNRGSGKWTRKNFLATSKHIRKLSTSACTSVSTRIRSQKRFSKKFHRLDIWWCKSRRNTFKLLNLKDRKSTGENVILIWRSALIRIAQSRKGMTVLYFLPETATMSHYIKC